MRHHPATVLFLGALLTGCLSILDHSAYFNPDYEGAIADQLRPRGLTLFEPEGGFSQDPVLVGFLEADGSQSTRIDAYRWETDQAWQTQLGGYGHELQNRNGGVVGIADTFHWERLDGLATPELQSHLYCNDEVELWVMTEIPEGQRLTDVAVGVAPTDCAGGRLGPGRSPTEQVLWLAGQARVLAFTGLVEGGIDVQETVVPTPAGVPDEVLWVASEAANKVSLAGVDADGSWHFTSTATGPLTAAEVTGAPRGLRPVVRVDPLTVEVHTLDGSWSWEVGGSGQVTQLDTTPIPSLSASWHPGPWPGGALAVERMQHPEVEEAELLVEVAAQALVDDGGVLSVVDVPLTPCVDDAACQELGEWTVVGLHPGPDGWYAIYNYFSWWFDVNGSEVLGTYVAPI